MAGCVARRALAVGSRWWSRSLTGVRGPRPLCASGGAGAFPPEATTTTRRHLSSRNRPEGKVLETVGVFEVPKQNGKYETGQVSAGLGHLSFSFLSFFFKDFSIYLWVPFPISKGLQNTALVLALRHSVNGLWKGYLQRRSYARHLCPVTSDVECEVLFPRSRMQGPRQWLCSGRWYWPAVIVGGRRGHRPDELAACGPGVQGAGPALRILPEPSQEPVLSKEQPAFQYSSHVSLQASSGHMWGTFRFERPDGSHFDVRIPPFSLESNKDEKTPPSGLHW
ncbi:polymerase delta-interacting protein 2 [Leptonychotes weddellii]|uniref:Polymerase delta-interacting protein 2 n=1 Tax=Leptonychotes weddellii TaxID=9713 RepID=A0A7F8QPC3_LEPWE|nr:polymerase delta-interacting protein 2 [Leptonychotes weddellii]